MEWRPCRRRLGLSVSPEPVFGVSHVLWPGCSGRRDGRGCLQGHGRPRRVVLCAVVPIAAGSTTPRKLAPVQGAGGGQESCTAQTEVLCC